MDTLTLRQLRYFAALRDEGHFGRAAERCAVSQPALSVQIKDLEGQFGFELFERGARGVRLTSMGDAFAGHAQRILQSVADLEDWATSAKSGKLERLRLGVIPTIAPYLVPKLVPALGHAFPDMDIHIRETVTPKLVEELSAGLIDAALVALPLDEPSLTELRLFSEDMVLIRHTAALQDGPLTADSIAHMRLLLLEEGHCFRDQTLSFCNINPRQRREGLDGSSLTTLVQMVGAGIGVTLIPDMAIPVETRSTPVQVCRFASPAPQRDIGLVWRSTNPIGNALTEIGQIIAQVRA
ncbi:hydrogen peroxide-inducible genes activator [uncultured Tateyamaria sp.]|uniref:hydrogen peroxide-inducible genes activator n=1 Tax=uncultured Tateyamaria sp. TaxID=455651 RepID=UPI0026279038|nr:hydrogen peroxide-inducible genes activator [uncultured Tateyamaria sp.]